MATQCRNVVRCTQARWTTAKDKEKAIQKFQTNKKCFAFLLSLKAANVGINLTKATRVILVDQSWNPADDVQEVDDASPPTALHEIGTSIAELELSEGGGLSRQEQKDVQQAQKIGKETKSRNKHI